MGMEGTAAFKKKEDIASGDGEEETHGVWQKLNCSELFMLEDNPGRQVEVDFEEPINHVKEDTDCPNHPFERSEMVYT